MRVVIMRAEVGERMSSHGRSPVIGDGRQIDLGEHEVNDSGEQVVLVLDVVVERHGLDVEGLSERAHGQSVEAGAVRHVEGGLKDPLPAERGPRSMRGWHAWHA
jgi:hypothetical protein